MKSSKALGSGLGAAEYVCEAPDIELAIRLLGRDAVLIGWGGRTRVVAADQGPLARHAAAMGAPAFHVTRRATLLAIGLKAALTPHRVRVERSNLVPAWLPVHFSTLKPALVILGSPGPAQTLVARLVDPRGKPRAVLKILVDAEAPNNNAITREAEALQASCVQGRAPTLLHDGILAGRPAIVMTYLPGRPGRSGRAGIRECLRVAPPIDPYGPRYAATEHPWVRRIADRAGLRLDAIASTMPGRYPLVRTHGDMAPWNLKVSTRAGVRAIDWEASNAHGFADTDTAHYVLSDALFLRRRKPGNAINEATEALVAICGMEHGHARAIVALSASHAWLRNMDDAGITPNESPWTPIRDEAAARAFELA